MMLEVSTLPFTLTQPVTLEVGLSKSAKKRNKAKNKVLEERNQKIHSLKNAIKDHSLKKEHSRTLQNLQWLPDLVATAVLAGFGMGISIVIDDAKTNDDTSRMQGLIFSMGIAASFTAYAIKVLLTDLSTISLFDDDDKSLIEDAEFHEFVIDKCHIDVDSYDIEALKNMYYKYLDKDIT